MSDGVRGKGDAVAAPGSIAALVDELAELLAVSDRFVARDTIAEAREIVAAFYDVPRFWPAANAHVRVESEMWPRARAAAQKRARGAPLAYAVGRANFRHLTLDIDERVLIPRPETELLVDLVLERALGQQELVVDVGTGSGYQSAVLAELCTQARVGLQTGQQALTRIHDPARDRSSALLRSRACDPKQVEHQDKKEQRTKTHAHIPPSRTLNEWALIRNLR